MLNFLKRLFSRKARLKARWGARLQGIDISKYAVCVECDDPILFGDFVGKAHVWYALKPQLIHAGFHETVTNEEAFCETAGIGIGYWDGEKIVNLRESAVSKAMRTGKPASEKY